jgi:hypothetical protein
MQALSSDHLDPAAAGQPVTPPPELSPARRKRHRFMLWVSVVVVVLSFLLECPSDQQVELHGVPLPGTCMSQTLFGLRCPGCGLTRSLVFLAHGDLAGSLRLHRLGWLLAAAVLAQFPYRLAALWCKQDYPLGRTFPKLFGHALIVLLIGNWLLEFVW